MAPNHFTSPSDVAVAANGDVFIADGHNEDGNNRVMKYNSPRRVPHVLGERPGTPQGSSVPYTPSTSTWTAGSSWEIEATAGSRFSTNRAIMPPLGPNSGAQAELPLTTRGGFYVADSESDNVQEPGV